MRISLSYTIGRTLGAGAVSRYGRRLHLTEDRLAQVHRWFDRVGHWALAIGYFIVGVRHVTAIVAGMSRLEFRSFALLGKQFTQLSKSLVEARAPGKGGKRKFLAQFLRLPIHRAATLIPACAGLGAPSAALLYC